MPYPYEHDLVQQPFSRCSAIHREKSVASFIRLLASTEEINPQKILNQSLYYPKGGIANITIYTATSDLLSCITLMLLIH